MTRHERFEFPRVIPRYEVDTLGAPFKVILLDCVTEKFDPSTGKNLTNVPDLVGLINVVVQERAICPRKLNGPEIKFIRNSLGIRATTLARFFEMSPEHLSRCEANAKVMSPLSERFFRLTTYAASFLPDAEEFLQEALKKGAEISADIERNVKQPNKLGKKFLEQFLTMKIEAVFDPDEELSFEFSRVPYDPTNSNSSSDHDKEPEWESRVACGCSF